MNNFCYSAIGILAIVTHMIVNYDYYIHKDNRKEISDYKKYLSATFAYFVVDAVWGLINGLHLTAALYITTVLYYITMVLSVVLCCRYIITFLHLKDYAEKLLNAFGILFAVSEIVVLFINHFYHIFFWFDEAGNYQAYTFRHIALVMQVAMFMCVSAISLVAAFRSHHFLHNRNLTISIYGITMTVALLSQTMFPLLPFYAVGLLVGNLIIHVFVRGEEQHFRLQEIAALNQQLIDEQKLLQSQHDEIATSLGIISGLSYDYHSIWWAYKSDMKLHMVRTNEKSAIKESVQQALASSNANEAMYHYVESHVAPEDRERLLQQITVEEILKQLSQQNFYGVNYKRILDDGTEDYNQIAFANATTADGKEILVFGFRDINDILRKEIALRRELNEAKEAAEAANAAKTSFLFNMSHDIRTPMNAIIGFRDLLEKYQEDPDKRRDYLQKIEESSDVLLSIINNVLEMARIEKGSMQLDESAWSAEQMNDSLYSVFEEMMQQKGLQFTREIDVQHHYVFCDATKTREIFYNIISNAYKYTPAGGHIHMKLQEIPSDREGFACYHTIISDTGIGMSEDFLPHLFEEFSREQNSTHSKIEGTGLGMPIVKRLVDFLGGKIEVESRKGEGTTFCVTLYHRIADRSMLSVPDVADSTPENFEGRRILLAEDNELNAEIAIEILSEIGFSVDRVSDGQECIETLVQAAPHYYDLILMDIQMPRMNGYEATRAIRALEDPEKAGIKILAMTANAFEEDKREAFRAGMNGHLAKPINVRELSHTLANNLNNTL